MNILPKLTYKMMTKPLAMLLAVGLSSPVLAMDVSDLPYDRDDYDECFLEEEEVSLSNLYYDILNYKLVKLYKAFNPTEESVANFYSNKERVDRYLTDSDIVSLPRASDIEPTEDVYTVEKAIDDTLFVAKEYYRGEVVPKDDFEAVKYLKKLVDYFENSPTDSDLEEDALFLFLMFGLAPDVEALSEDNPLKNSDEKAFFNSVFKLAIEAGSIEVQAEYLRLDFGKLKSWEKNELILFELVKLAEQGSRTAIRALASEYRDLAEQEPKIFNQLKKYWQEKENQLSPMKQISWN